MNLPVLTDQQSGVYNSINTCKFPVLTDQQSVVYSSINTCKNSMGLQISKSSNPWDAVFYGYCNVFRRYCKLGMPDLLGNSASGCSVGGRASLPSIERLAV